MQFREEKNGDFTVIWDSADDLHRFLGVKVRRRRKHLYKYSRGSEYLLDSLRRSYLWLSKPSDFNDPFDCKVVIDYQVSQEQLETQGYFTPDRHDKHDGAPRPKVVRIFGEGNFKYASRFAIDASEMEHPKWKNRVMNLAQLASRSAFLDQSLGVCCFAEDARSILMWSHYSANHSGVCLRFKHRSSEGLSGQCLPVQYRRAVWTCKSRINDPISEVRALMRSVLVKSSVWEYEREWRTVALDSGERPFNPSDIDGVILGVNISKQDRRRILSVLKRKKYSHVDVMQACQHPFKYGLRIVSE